MKTSAFMIALLALSGCSSFPPLSIGAGFMGATVNVSTPGWSSPVHVVPLAQITKPTLLVPKGSGPANDPTAVVSATSQTDKMSVPVVVAPVKSATLAVPPESKLSALNQPTKE